MKGIICGIAACAAGAASFVVVSHDVALATGCNVRTAQIIVNGKFSSGSYVIGSKSRGTIVAFKRGGSGCAADERSSVSTVQMWAPGSSFVEVGYEVHEPPIVGGTRYFRLFVEHSSPGVDGGNVHVQTYAPPCTIADGADVVFTIDSTLSDGTATQNWNAYVSCDGVTQYRLQCSGQAGTTCNSGAWHVDDSVGRSTGEEESFGGAYPYDIHRHMYSYYGGFYAWQLQTCRYFYLTTPGWKYFPNSDGAGGTAPNAFVVYGGSPVGC